MSNASTKREKRYVAIDQYGDVTRLNTPYPRKELLSIMGRSHAEMIYRGAGRHVGYVIAGHWFEVFEIRPAFAPESER